MRRRLLDAPGLPESPTRPALDLTGTWGFALDPEDLGTREGWSRTPLGGAITVPGSWEEQGYGDVAPEFIGGWTKRRAYAGAAWYAREVEIPASWTGRRIWLQLDRVGWQSRVYLDGSFVDENDSLSVPHRYDLTDVVRAGTTHRLAIRVDNATDTVNYEGHVHSRHTATLWGGIVGPVRLLSTPTAWIERVAVEPDAATGTVAIHVRVDGAPTSGTVKIIAGAYGSPVAQAVVPITPDPLNSPTDDGDDRTDASPTSSAGVVVTGTLELGDDARRWSDRDPFLYDLEVGVHTPEGEDRVNERFGLRTFCIEDRRFTLNGEPLFLRGYVDCCIFPLTGYPPEDKAVYAAQFAKAKEYGFNHVRLHSWTPSRVFFEAADEAGILVQSELPNWSSANDPAYVDAAGPFLRREFDRVLANLQSHASLVIHSMGNELLQSPPGGSGQRYSEFLNELVRYGRAVDPTRLYLDQSGFGFMPEETERETDLFVYHTFRGSSPDTTTTWQHRIAGGKTPVIAHEHTQMDSYVRLNEAAKYTGALDPSWIHQAATGLASKHRNADVERFVDGAAALQTTCLKELFERVRRTPGLAGLQMLNLIDFPGQGTALNGVLDAFWDDKGHLGASRFRTFNDRTVLLWSAPRRTFPTGGWLEGEIQVSHFDTAPLNGPLHWSLAAADGTVLAEDSQPISSPPVGHPWPLAPVRVQMPTTGSDQLTLTAWIESTDGTIHNSWDVWVLADQRCQNLPARTLARSSLSWLSDYYADIAVDDYAFLSSGRRSAPEEEVLLTDRLHVRYVDAMLNGASVVWLAEDDALADGVPTRFESLFWSFLWFPEQANQTMGLVVRDHPLLRGFPHDGHADWQWYHLVDGATAVGMDAVPPEVEPIVEGIDNWNRAKRLGYLIEARVGRGRLLLTTLRLLSNYHEHPEAVRMLDAMVHYAGSDAFAPTGELNLAHLWSFPRTPVGWSRP